MYFKQLEIVGFKSFPHKTKIKFEPGVTAIVGPNGCGKSNISDAIRWVLGEQSAKSLRGGSMEDVIFNGTDSAEPINMAEVSLTLSNEDKALPIDYDEVTITRRLFRSGESEYILNKNSVRLKDIMQLLMGTGLGTDSYSTIEQGKIDLILSSKPEERRFIFEEASGITRYKAKKKEALRKLEHTENNLVRINDIITEVKRQINSVERHAKKAERYRNDFEIMKDLDLKIAKCELNKLSQVLEDRNKEFETVSSQEINLKLELDEILAFIGNYRENLDKTIYDLTETQRNLSAATITMDKARHKIEINKERIGDLIQIKRDSDSELLTLNEKLKFHDEEIAKYKKHFEEMATCKEEKEKTLSEKEEAVRVYDSQMEEHQKDIKEAKNKTLDLLAFQTKTKNELIKLGADLQNRKTRLRRLETEKESIAEERRTAESALADINNELDTSRTKVQGRKITLEEFKGRLTSYENKLEEVTGRISDSLNHLNSLKSKEEMLREMIENLEGFDKGVKIIMDAFKEGSLGGIKGPIADMIEPAEGYEAALEVALDSKAQAIIVDDTLSLERAVSYLGDKGKVRLLSFDDTQYADRSAKYKDVAEQKGIATFSSFVKVDPSLKNVVDYLLKDIYVVDNAEIARDILKDHGGMKFVTKNGFYIEKGYTYGGLFDTETVTSLIGRAKRLQHLIEEQKKIKDDVEKLKSEQDEYRRQSGALKDEITETENALKREEIELANILSRRETIENNFKKIDDELSVIKLEMGEEEGFIHEISFKGEDLNKRLNENEALYSREQELMTSSQNAIQEKTKIKNDLLMQISETRSEIAFLKNTEETEARNLNKEINLFKELCSQRESREKSAKEAEQKKMALEAETVELESKIEALRSEEGRLREEMEKVTEYKTSLAKEIKQKEEEVRTKEILLEDLRSQVRNLELENKEKELKIARIKEKTRDVYKIDIENESVHTDENIDWEEAKNQVDILKIKLEKMGPVNLIAIDEHKELEERYAFLKQQEEDLLRAKDSLHKAIVKINKTTKSLFIETFQKIQIEFKNYFRMLFGGGHAELILLDESDVLESGIEIVVRPPGKKLQNLLLLSGGEKALTAISLLFAVFKVKPSPFCILDEVDAPLDESNIGKFSKILREFLKTSQFIVITHSKRTMQMADVLYGITMQQKGISNIVSVKFGGDGQPGKPAADKQEEVLV